MCNRARRRLHGVETKSYLREIIKERDERDGASVSRSLYMPGKNKVIVRAVSFDNKQHVSNEVSGGDEITLVSSAKDWLSENYGQGDGANYAEEEAAKEDEVLQETFVAWRELYEAELAIELTKLMPESALTAPKEKKLTGRQWFESGKASRTMVAANQESEEEDDEDTDFTLSSIQSPLLIDSRF
ncbi:uncharacterized protein LOC130512323 isoform X1 [Raphanus sativus]|uniref:Uncharacterized protein LOC108830850 isoform X1 n=2 Tax=Raphanus sativus TaxID=3726 RepID=A0A6J0P2Q9_RAPSA|nr:uncharacterized protein LOC108830850 isoform X1 [Raphanus sativus]XP_018491079.1 uncharacterized protein LOC108861654 isoform X1 [Raphanus sativus]XP_056849384.1 uncharacterized protein LOC130494364 isoform X1 [Raphanus sativus]XP_056852013.1 uncharacterized protein LOC130494436 isoform X1 [Raphanus sativus]XP_056862747.1 uncharacterized protein LOC130510448 isoform X1 [Raphanus sativus]XP_056863756.1 uncharacterized protein LOC130510998 isoform X1 [Raphanus sativus]XP_056866148.1 uncharac